MEGVEIALTRRVRDKKGSKEAFEGVKGRGVPSPHGIIREGGVVELIFGGGPFLEAGGVLANGVLESGLIARIVRFDAIAIGAPTSIDELSTIILWDEVQQERLKRAVVLVVWEEEDVWLHGGRCTQFAELGKARGMTAEITGVAERCRGRVGIEEKGRGLDVDGKALNRAILKHHFIRADLLPPSNDGKNQNPAIR